MCHELHFVLNAIMLSEVHL